MKKYTFAQYASALWLPLVLIAIVISTFSAPLGLLTSALWRGMRAASTLTPGAAFTLGLGVCVVLVLLAQLVLQAARGIVKFTCDSPPLWRGEFTKSTPQPRSFGVFTSAYAEDRSPAPQRRSPARSISYAAAMGGAGVGAVAGYGAYSGYSDPHDMSDPLYSLNTLQAQQLEQMQEPQRIFPLVNPTTGITMSADSGIDDTGHVYCDPTPIYEAPHYETPSYDYGNNNCGGGGCGGFDF